jgi:hypothetical protein
MGQYAERGAVVGGVGGALAGAAIGKNNGDTGKGALIGGALGLVTGTLIGDSMDQDRYRQQVVQQQQLVQMSRAVSTYDVVNMCRSGVGDQVIIAHIQTNGVQRRLEVNDIIALHQQGVSQPVINAMQNAAMPSYAPTVVAAPQPATVIVKERYVAPPVYYAAPPHYYYHHHHSARHYPPPGVHWGVTIGR